MSNQNPDKEKENASMLSALDDFLNHKETSPKLSNQQLDALEYYLDSHAAQNAMHMEVLDGFLCALITSPVPVSPEEYLPRIFGGKMPEFKSQQESDMVMGALAQHWEHIDSVLKRGDEYYPFLYADPDGKCGANEWAYGFILGMDMQPRQLEGNGRGQQTGRPADPDTDALFRIHSRSVRLPANPCGGKRRTGYQNDFQSPLDLRAL